MKRFDLYLASAVVIIALVWFFIIKFFSNNGDMVYVYRDNILVENYSLEEEGIYNVCNDTNDVVLTYEIINHGVNVIYANCNDLLCVHQKPIYNNTEAIVCLPNKIVIEIKSDSSTASNGDLLDAVSK